MSRSSRFVLIVTLLACAPGLGAAVTPEGQLVVTDPVWSQEPADHNTFPVTDLTELRIVNSPDELWLEIPFYSDWPGLQLHFLLETGFNAAGATRDPFEQPVNYAHSLKPDYAITCRYSTGDWGDARRWNTAISRWEWYDPATGLYSSEYAASILSEWTTKTDDSYSVHIPWGAFGGRPDSLMVAVYLTQYDGGDKRSAFDSVPSDATLDLDFDYQNPGPGDWNVALGPVSLSAWSPVYHVRTTFPVPPQVVGVTATPAALVAGGSFVLAADVNDMGDGVEAVLADLSALGGFDEEMLFDDGDPAHGDAVAGDGRYSLHCTVPPWVLGGTRPATVSAYDSTYLQRDTAAVAISVMPSYPLRQTVDVAGDDHGPNQPGVRGLYYTYPTNPIFVAGSCDLTGLEIRRVGTRAGATVKEWIAFTVRLLTFTGPGEPNYADWNPAYAGMNREKVDILIDARTGGSTASLPGRRAGYAAHDAWDYAIVLDGWVKAVVPYTGSDDLAVWLADARTSDQDIMLLGDTQANTVTALVDPAVLGNPSDADLRAWDICAQASSRDAGGFEVLGGVRWVDLSASEWNFGGGTGGGLDSNLLDLLLSPGTGHARGRPQEYVLDCTTSEAVARTGQGLPAVAIEVTSVPVSTVGVAPSGPLVLQQNAPNPFNPGTVIRFSLPAAATADLRVFDIGGRVVRTLLVAAELPVGSHEVAWDGTDDQGRPVAAGAYYCRLASAGVVATGKMTLLK